MVRTSSSLGESRHGLDRSWKVPGVLRMLSLELAVPESCAVTRTHPTKDLADIFYCKLILPQFRHSNKS